MIKRRIEKLGRKIAEQSHKLLGTERRSDNDKRKWIDDYIDSMMKHVPNCPREGVALVVTAFVSAIRLETVEWRQSFFKDDMP